MLLGFVMILYCLLKVSTCHIKAKSFHVHFVIKEIFSLECLTILLPSPFSYNYPYLCISNLNPLIIASLLSYSIIMYYSYDINLTSRIPSGVLDFRNKQGTHWAHVLK